MPATRFDLAERALLEIGVLAAGETASAEDQSLAEMKFDAVHASLGARGLLRWTLSDIPIWAEEPLVQMTAALLLKPFGMQPDDSGWTGGEAEIRRCIQVDWTGGPTEFESF